MKNLQLKTVVLLMIFAIAAGSCSSKLFSGRGGRKAEKEISGSSRGYRESRKVRWAKKQQERRERKKDNAYRKHVATSRERTLEIQSPDVRERMKQNQASLAARDKNKNRRIKTATKKAGKKYR